jgi:hypothetical protein
VLCSRMLGIFLLAIAVYVLLRITASGYPWGISNFSYYCYLERDCFPNITKRYFCVDFYHVVVDSSSPKGHSTKSWSGHIKKHYSRNINKKKFLKIYKKKNKKQKKPSNTNKKINKIMNWTTRPPTKQNV